ncbi:hypothetical protein [Pseudomonas sp. 18175]|uniref:hypothetical protein n=1 Tax=Pseudomonas sp. 18175 TaxID=3390056 RepID=UPI003D244F0E
MSTEKVRKTSALTEFFTKTSDEDRRAFYMGVIDKANASQREVVQKAEAIKAARVAVQDS